MDFTLKIELGDDAMRTTADVAAALREAADYIGGVGEWGSDTLPGVDGEGTVWHLDAGSVRDLHGNTVGEWEVA